LDQVQFTVKCSR